jgi:hypothetical protein
LILQGLLEVAEKNVALDDLGFVNSKSYQTLKWEPVNRGLIPNSKMCCPC